MPVNIATTRHNPNTTVLFSLVQDLEIIINADKTKHFQHCKPETIVLYMVWFFVGGGGLERKGSWTLGLQSN